MSDIAILHRCSAHAPVPVGTPVRRLAWRTIDVHCHVMVPAVEALVADHPARIAQAADEVAALGSTAQSVNAAQFGTLMPRLTAIEDRLRDMDAMGVDIQILSPSPTQYHYWAEPDLAATLTGMQNDRIGDYCALHPDRFLGLGAVALQHPAQAADQLEALMRDRGFKGAEISSLVDGRDVADRFFDPFWARAEALGAVIFIHPWGTTLGTRLADHYLMNIIGQPLETTICLSKLIFGGTFDRHPGLRIVAAHGGGFLPAYGGRSDHAHAVRPDARGCGCRPTDYLQRIWFDTVVHDPDQLRRLVEHVGADRVVTGSDYPFDMGEYDPSGLVAALEPNVQRLILGANAEALFGLD